MAVRCPVCRKVIAGRHAAQRPFCSQRCRLLDLGDWLDGHHIIPASEVIDADALEDSEDSSRQQETPSARRLLH